MSTGAGQDAVEALVLGAPVELTREQVTAAAGVPEAEARALWVALGFPEVPSGARAFTRRDAEALRTAWVLQQSGVLDGETLLILARATGQGMARLAEAQLTGLRSADAGLTHDEVVTATARDLETVLPGLERLVVHVWRRQLAAATARALAAGPVDGLPVLVVGFVDLVGFTRGSREWRPAELEALLERFEQETAQRVTRHGGRVVKTLGDAVMWVCDEPGPAAEIALGTVEAHGREAEALPPVRAGVAMGGVVLRLGDVFGQPVNLASRLTAEARPGTVLVDVEAHAALAQDPAYDLVALPPRRVTGYGALLPHVLRRRTASVPA